MTTLAFVVPIDPECQISEQILRAAQGFGVIIEPQFMFEGVERAFHTALSQQQALAEMLQLIWWSSSNCR